MPSSDYCDYTKCTEQKKNIYRNDPIDLALLLPTVHHDDPIWTEQHQIKTLKVPQSAPLVRVIWY